MAKAMPVAGGSIVYAVTGPGGSGGVYSISFTHILLLVSFSSGV